MLDNNYGWHDFVNYVGTSIYERFMMRTKSQRKRRKFTTHKTRVMKRK